MHCRLDLAAGDRRPLCGGCAALLETVRRPFCERCGLPVEGGGSCARCRDRLFRCAEIRAAFLYGPQAQSLIVRFKYAGRSSLAEPLGDWMAETLARSPELDCDALVPVPLHPRRLRERGFNQASLLARQVAKRRSKRALEALERIRKAPPQAGLGRDERLVNLRGAYRAMAGVEGLSLLLIDDVATTGATLEECAAALKEAGARKVSALVFARQPL